MSQGTAGTKDCLMVKAVESCQSQCSVTLSSCPSSPSCPHPKSPSLPLPPAPNLPRLLVTIYSVPSSQSGLLSPSAFQSHCFLLHTARFPVKRSTESTQQTGSLLTDPLASPSLQQPLQRKSGSLTCSPGLTHTQSLCGNGTFSLVSMRSCERLKYAQGE